MMRTAILLGMTLSSTAFVLVSSVQAQVNNDPAAVKAAAKEAYIFTYPLVLNYRTMYAQAIKKDREFGKWLHLGVSSPKDTDIVTPNLDTPYSYAWLDLRAEPWVLMLPKVEKDRFITSQWDDLWAFVLDNAGSVNDGNDGVTVMLASPSWNGEVPAGVNRIIRGESDFIGTLTRTQLMASHGGLERVKEIQRQYKLQPLSTFLGTAAPSAAPKIDWPAWTEGDEATEKFWSYVAFLLPYVTPNDADAPMYEKLAAIGVERGKPWDAAALDPKVREAIKAGVKEARAEIQKVADTPGLTAANFFGDRKKVGTDYLDRTMGVYMGIFGNVVEQSFYFSLPTDSNDQPFDGSKHSYTLTFPEGKTPPVQYFWSLSMYNLPDRFLVENPIDRYSISSATPGLNKNDEGVITLYISAKSPGNNKESNWLPAPEGPFWLVLRTYGPARAIVDGSYKVPPIIPSTSQ